MFARGKQEEDRDSCNIPLLVVVSGVRSLGESSGGAIHL